MDEEISTEISALKHIGLQEGIMEPQVRLHDPFACMAVDRIGRNSYNSNRLNYNYF